MKKLYKLKYNWRVKCIEPTDRLSRAQLEALGNEGAEGEDGWYAAQMPMQIQDVLIEAGVIENPAETGNAEKCLWVAEKDWIYRAGFKAEKNGGRAFLSFEGLDTLADVYLNGRHIASHCDLYLPLRVEVSDLLEAENMLAIHFHSPHEYLKKTALRPEWEGKVPKYKLLRKSIHDFFNYLGMPPYFTHMGVYGDIVLNIADSAEIIEADVEQELSEDFKRARIRVGMKCAGDAGEYMAKVMLVSPGGKVAGEEVQTVWLHEGRGSAGIEITFDEPELWWPANHGGQPLYQLEMTLENSSGVLDRMTRRIGFRKIELKGPLDFLINGRAIKLYGSVIMPIHGVSYCWDEERGLEIAEKAAFANMNILRIWHEGGVTYPDSLYDEFDKRGILIWQDFFATYSHMPDDEDYRSLCRLEAECLVKRLKHRPCILLWCGGNETLLGAELAYNLEKTTAGAGRNDFDFGKSYEGLHGSRIFLEDYKEVCRRLDPDRFYLENSPWGGVFSNDPRVGDAHGWDTEYYYSGTEVSYFLTENCRSVIPVKRSLERIVGRKNLWPEGYTGLHRHSDAAPIPSEWQKHTSGGMVRWIARETGDFYNAENTDELIYMINAAQEKYVKRSLGNCRRGRLSTEPDGPRRSAGHLLLRMNDTFPSMFCGLLDYYLEAGMPYYALKRLYEPVLLSFDIGDSIYLWAVNDGPEDIEADVEFRLFDPDANAFCAEITSKAAVRSGESKKLFDLDSLRFFKRSCILYACMKDGNGRVIARANDCVELERFVKFPDAGLDIKIGNRTLAITADRFARCIELLGNEDGDEFGWFFEDNYFDLLPGEVKYVKIMGRHEKGTITAKAHYSTKASTVCMG